MFFLFMYLCEYMCVCVCMFHVAVFITLYILVTTVCMCVCELQCVYDYGNSFPLGSIPNRPLKYPPLGVAPRLSLS